MIDFNLRERLIYNFGVFLYTYVGMSGIKIMNYAQNKRRARLTAQNDFTDDH